MPDKYTIEEWMEECEQGSLIDYDGIGYFGTEDKESKVEVVPSSYQLVPQINSIHHDGKYTHVWWYNR